MKVKPILDCPSFDLYDLGANRDAPEREGLFGFRGARLDLETAQEAAYASRKQGCATVVVPTAYHEAKLTLAEARDLAIDAFERRKHLNPNHKFGELDAGSDEGGWWLFVADNLTAQDAGSIPGLFMVRVDKLLRRVLSLAESTWVDRIQVDPSAGSPSESNPTERG